MKLLKNLLKDADLFKVESPAVNALFKASFEVKNNKVRAITRIVVERKVKPVMASNYTWQTMYHLSIKVDGHTYLAQHLFNESERIETEKLLYEIGKLAGKEADKIREREFSKLAQYAD